MTSDPLTRIIPLDGKNEEALSRINTLEDQLLQTAERVRMREDIILQLKEEILAKEQLIFEQSHLIEILEAEHNNSHNEKMDGNEESMHSDSEVTIIERIGVAGPSKSEEGSPSSSIFDEAERLRESLERAMLDREKLELQNEQLLRQWEEALEYVSRVQKQLQEEIKRNTDLKERTLDMQKRNNDTICISREMAQFIVILFAIFSFYLYMC